MIDKEDISSIVSVYPLAFVNEMKPGLTPNLYTIPKCDNPDNPVIVHIGPAVHNVYIGENRNFPIESGSFVVAKAVINDIVNSMLETDTYGKPGFVAIPERVEQHHLKTKYKNEITELIRSQHEWFRKIAEVAENDWQQYHKHTVISPIQRLAAKCLDLNKEWMTIQNAEAPAKCIACTSMIPRDALVCPICRTIVKPEEYKSLKLASA